MLSLGRNPGQYVVIDGTIVVQVVSVDGMLRLAIDAPKDVLIERGENYEKANAVPDCILRSGLSEKKHQQNRSRSLKDTRKKDAVF